MDVDPSPSPRASFRTRSLIAVTLVLSLGTGAWLLRDSTSPSADSESPPTMALQDADSSPGPDLAGSGAAEVPPPPDRGVALDAERVLWLERSLAQSLPQPPLDEIVGSVVDEQGIPIPRIHLALFTTGVVTADGPSWRELRQIATGVSDWAGVIHLDSERPAPCWIRIDDSSEWRSDPVEVSKGGPLVRLVALRHETVRLRVFDALGRAIRGARLTARRSIVGAPWTLERLGVSDWETAVVATNKAQFTAVTDAEGRASLPIPDRRARMALDVAPPNEQDDQLPFHTDSWDGANDTTIRLTTGSRVRGRVVDPKGALVSHGVIRFAPEGQAMGLAAIGSDGSFELPLMSPGRLRVVALDPRVLLPLESPPINVHAGTNDVTLVLDTGADLLVRMSHRRKGSGSNVVLSLEGDSDATHGITIATLDSEGSAVLHGLREGERYVLWIPPDRTPALGEPSKCVYRTGIALRDSPLAVEETDGKSLDVDIFATGSDRRITVANIDDRGIHLSTAEFLSDAPGDDEIEGDPQFIRRRAPTRKASPEKHWTTRFVGLPEGSWTVRAHGIGHTSTGNVPLVGEATGETGGRVRIVLAPATPSSK